jgi:hypothetical protein
MCLGSGIRKKPVPDPGSRVKKGTRSRIRNAAYKRTCNDIRHTQIDVGDGVLVDGCLVHVTGYEVQGVRVQGGGGRARQVQARGGGGRYKVVFARLLPVLWIRIRIGSGSRKAKMTHKHRKKLIKFHLLKCCTYVLF